MTASSPLPTNVLDQPIGGRGLEPHGTFGALLGQASGPTILVFLRHHG